MPQSIEWPGVPRPWRFSQFRLGTLLLPVLLRFSSPPAPKDELAL